MPNAKLVSLPEAAKLLELSVSQIRYLIRKGLLPATSSKERLVRLADVRKARKRPKRGNPNWKRKDTKHGRQLPPQDDLHRRA